MSAASSSLILSTSKSITSAPGESSTRLSPPSRAGPEALFVAPDPLFNTERAQLWTWQRAMRFPRPTSSAITLKAAA